MHVNSFLMNRTQHVTVSGHLSPRVLHRNYPRELWAVATRVAKWEFCFASVLMFHCSVNIYTIQNNSNPAHHERHISKYISGAGLSITSQRYPPLVTILIVSRKLWFKGDVIRKALVGVLEEDGNDEWITD